MMIGARILPVFVKFINSLNTVDLNQYSFRCIASVYTMALSWGE